MSRAAAADEADAGPCRTPSLQCALMRARSVSIRLILSLSALTITSCGGAGDDNAQARATGSALPQAAATGRARTPVVAPTDTTPLPDGAWRDLARRLVGATTLQTAVDVTREVLARGGVSTFDGQRVLVNAAAPAALFQATPLETVHLAMEARRRPQASRLTAAELAQMLETFGFPFPGADPDAAAAGFPRGAAAEPDEIRDAEQKERRAQSDRERASREALTASIEAERAAGRARVEAARQRVAEATDAWQRLRLPAARATGSEKAAAQARLDEAFAARKAAIDELGVIRTMENEADRERRTRASRLREEAYRLERIGRRIGPDYAAGDRLMDMLAQWVSAAAQTPNDPRSFTPLFLAEMARLQDAPVDLLGSRYARPGRGEGPPVDLRGAPRSAQLRLTLLEIELIAAAFLRPASPVALRGAPPGRGGPRVMHASYAAPAQDPCSDFKKTLENIGKVLGGDVGQALGGIGASEIMGGALGKAIESAVGNAAADTVGKAISAVGSAAKIAKLVSFYSDGQVSVAVEPRSIHKPTAGTSLVAYTATVGVSDQELEEYERMTRELSDVDRATRDCLENAGVPKLAGVPDFAKEVDGWLVEWKLVEGAPPHAYYSLRNNDYYLPGRGAMKLQRSGASSASAIFVVDILPEQRHTGTVVRAYVTARVAVDAATPPSLGTFLNPLKGVLGLVDALVELGVGWFQHMNMPKAYGTIEVEYHCPNPTTLHRPKGTPVADGGGDGPNECLIAAGREG